MREEKAEGGLELRVDGKKMRNSVAVEMRARGMRRESKREEPEEKLIKGGMVRPCCSVDFFTKREHHFVSAEARVDGWRKIWGSGGPEGFNPLENQDSNRQLRQQNIKLMILKAASQWLPGRLATDIMVTRNHRNHRLVSKITSF